MKFSVEKEVFQDVLQEVALALPRSSPIPIMNNILLRLEGNDLTVYATNLDFSIQDTIEVQGEEDGVITLPGKPLLTIVSNIPSGPIQIEAQPRTAKIMGRTGVYNLIGTPPEDFPPMREVSAPEVVEIPWAVIRKGIEYVGFCAAKDDARAYLNGILWQLRDGELRFVASDAHRLGYYRVISGDFRGSADVIIPRDALEFFRKRDRTEEGVKVLFSESQIGFEKGRTRVVSRLIEGPYANYEDVIPRPDGNVFRIAKAELEDSIKRILPFTESPSHTIRMDLSTEGVRLLASSPEIGDAEEHLSGNYVGDELQVGINAQYLLDIIRHIDDEEVLIRVYTPNTALRIDPATSLDDESLLFLMMPVRLE